MDWTYAIERNREALVKIVTGWLALIDWLPGTIMPKVLPSHTRRKIAHSLPAAEAALRRLIVLFVQVNAIKPPKPRDVNSPLPDFSSFSREKKENGKPPRFRLIDPRKPLVFGVSLKGPATAKPANRSGGVPRIRFFHEPPPLVPLFVNEVPAPATDEKHADPAKLLNRLAALDHALNTIPQQATRLARLMERRTKKPPGPGRTGPIRPGHPPGWGEKAGTEIQNVLRECQGLLVKTISLPDPP